MTQGLLDADALEGIEGQHAAQQVQSYDTLIKSVSHQDVLQQQQQQRWNNQIVHLVVLLFFNSLYCIRFKK